MNTKPTAILILLLCAVGLIWLVPEIMTSRTSSLSTAIKFVGAVLALLCFFRPKMGLYVIIAEAFTTDFLKKIAVYYGSTSSEVIIEVMVVVMLAVVGTIAGMLSRSLVFKHSVMSRNAWLIFFAGLAWAAAILVIGILQGLGIGLGRIQLAFNSGAYMALAAVIMTYIPTRKEFLKLMGFASVFALLSCFWALKQAFWGWSIMEEYYAVSGLSPIATIQYLQDTATDGAPRPCGFGSGSKSLGFLAAFAAYAFYRLLTVVGPKKVLWALAVIIFYAGLILSRQKAPMIVGFAAPALVLVLRSKVITAGLYSSGLIAFVLIVLNADMIRSNMTEIDASVRGEAGVSTAYSLKTFSTRLESYAELKKFENWSFFGLSEMERGNVDVIHDVFTSLLVKTGAVGLFSLLIIVGLVAFWLHRQVWGIQAPTDRRMALFLMAYLVPGIVSNFIGGSNMHTLPVNLTIWIFFGGVITLTHIRNEEEPVKVYEIEPQPA